MQAISAGVENPRALVDVAKLAWYLGGDLGELPIAWTSHGLMSTSQLRAWLASRMAVAVASTTPFQQATAIGAEVQVGDDVVVVSRGGQRVLAADDLTVEDEWVGYSHLQPAYRHHDALLVQVLECVAEAWGLASAELLEPLHDVTVQVGTMRGAPVIEQGLRLVRPSSINVPA